MLRYILIILKAWSGDYTLLGYATKGELLWITLIRKKQPVIIALVFFKPQPDDIIAHIAINTTIYVPAALKQNPNAGSAEFH